MKSIKLILLLLIGIFGCKETESPRPFGRESFPIQLGRQWTYDVDSFYFNPFTETTDSFSFRIRKTVEQEILGGDMETKYLARYERLDTSGNWVFEAFAEIRKTDVRVTEEYENQAIVKLVFPIADRKSWDGNQANALDADLFRYRNVESPFNVAGKLYPTTVTVEQEKDSNFFQVFDRQEVFAENIGMIYKKDEQTEIQFDVKEGYFVAWSLVSYKP